MNSKQLREQLGAKHDELRPIWDEAQSAGGGIDFGQVKCLGAAFKDAGAVHAKFLELTAEAEDIAQKAETAEAAEKAGKAFSDRENQRNRPAFPQGGAGKGNYPDERERMKSLGEMIAESKAYQGWNRSGGLDLSFDEILPSELLAKAMTFNTFGAKTLMTTSTGFAPEVTRAPGFVDMVTRPLQLLDIIPVFSTDQAAYKYMEETTRAHAAAETAEGGAYAEDAFAFTEKLSPVQKITTSLPVTDEQLDDVAVLSNFIPTRLSFSLRQRFDGQCLVGNGTTPNLRGLKNVAGTQTQAKGADTVLDALYKGMDKIGVVGRSIPTHYVLHSTDWQKIRLTQTVDGVYIFGSPMETGSDRLWGLPVVKQQIDAAGTAYVGSFLPDAVALFERKGIDIQMGYVGTQFAEGKRTFRADMRAALVWQRPAAFCSVTGL